MSLFSVPVILNGILRQIEIEAETALEAVAKAAVNNPNATVAGPAAATVVSGQSRPVHGHHWPT
jgi:hypothetical protein